MIEPNDRTNLSGEQDRKLDAMLDSMLSEYSAVEPRPGLETRILANLNPQRQPAPWWKARWMWGGIALASTAVILLMVYFSRPHSGTVPPQMANSPEQHETPAPKTHSTIAAPPVIASVPAHSSRSVHQGRKANRPADTAARETATRREVFPSPSPLSDQEKLLLQYLASTPRQEIVAQSHPDPPKEDPGGGSDNDQPDNLTRVYQTNSNTR